MGDRLTKWRGVLRRRYYRLTIGQWGLIAIALVLIFGPLGSPKGPGLQGKTWWDWLQLAGVPVSLAFVGLWFQHQQALNSKKERERQRKHEIAKK